MLPCKRGISNHLCFVYSSRKIYIVRRYVHVTKGPLLRLTAQKFLGLLPGWFLKF